MGQVDLLSWGCAETNQNAPAAASESVRGTVGSEDGPEIEWP